MKQTKSGSSAKPPKPTKAPAGRPEQGAPSKQAASEHGSSTKK